jgi:hypothetical protein
MSTTDSNILNLQIPTSLSGSGGGGLNLNFDFGANTSALANGAYSFLNQSFANSNAFAGNAISGAQSFLSGIVSPIVQASQSQINQNTSLMPSLYQNLFTLGNTAQNLSANLVNTSLGVQKAIGVASINASSADAQAADNSGGGCFITTAVCEYMGWADDCDMLTAFRKYRDQFMLTDPERAKLVKEYYEKAPGIVEAIKQKPAARVVWRYILHAFLRPAFYKIMRGDMQGALTLYREMFEFAEESAHG